MSTVKNALVAAAVVVAAVGFGTGTAQAATGYDRCPAGNICLFDLPNGQGAMAWFKIGSPNLAGQSMDNRADSLWNRNASAFCLYLEHDYVNQGGVFQPGARGDQLLNSNAYSSLRKC
ncbi:hypothetical protein FHS29_005688 [Saccharothrix tamanrassetensis]|uniref:Peptidase inhibitor family I36 n=1 Tax=Saccharothrix tamanrassetensis TaxID=1051531 RepID=A0A841CSE1_9PSEU|nr:peptidase inhibitor family I36 protein [Saccharothrix tamanrassetensis]MBB5959068.1 hypothetical protein [Saccharothrix tamanrassetensis]